MRKWLVNLILKPVLIVLAGGAMGLAFGVIPCYLFPLLGGVVRNWCGHRSEPPHFVLQFWLGFLLAAAVTSWVLYCRKRSRGGKRPEGSK